MKKIFFLIIIIQLFSVNMKAKVVVEKKEIDLSYVKLNKKVAYKKEVKQSYILKNNYIKVNFTFDDGVCRLTRLERLDGSNLLSMESDEFEISFFDKSQVTAKQYFVDDIKQNTNNLKIYYRRHKQVSKNAPERIEVNYTLDEGPYLFKDVYLEMKEGQKIDRLQVVRISTNQKATRGGQGQPVFINNWFFGINYPCFYSRHSNNFTEPNFNYRWHYTIDLEGGDKEFNPRDGLVTLFHFPGYAKKEVKKGWGIHSKRAVIGIAKNKDDGPELGLLDYIDEKRKPARSYLHFNNWYSPEAKAIVVDDFVDDMAVKIKNNLEKYGAHLDAIVPDDGWQRKEGMNRIYESKYPLHEVSNALRKINLDFGIWLAIDGTTTGVNNGINVGYKPAIPDSDSTYKKKERYWGGQRYFNLLDTQYQKDYRESVRYLMQECDVRYIKHDFNHMYTYGYLNERHAREACLDVTIDLMRYERKLNPKVIINYTNGTFFTPFWLLDVEYLWMNSGDQGNDTGIPQLCKLDDATSYRDIHFYQSFNNPTRTVRPIIPISNFMTHGILHASKAMYYNPEVDPIHDWLNYLVMYYGRGTMLKELYLSPDKLTEDMWKGLGTASAWAQKNQDLLMNTVLVGGNPAKGNAYGYVSWLKDKAMLTVRNPSPDPQIIKVPFDASVYFRGEPNQVFHMRTVYPFVEHMPWELTSGKMFTFEIPGSSVIVYEITKGAPLSVKSVKPKPLPAVVSAKTNENSYKIQLQIPDEEFLFYELQLYHGKIGKRLPSIPTINNIPLKVSRKTDNGMILTTYDLRPYRGKTITITGETLNEEEQISEAWLIVDRKVDDLVNASCNEDVLPWSMQQNYRRITQKILP